ncbi:hypothetical protein BKA64DRAFT_673464 [Cadophora sp. MPI-SDFR-AT-0126]|nr:hypothetical protein BKA64DRAFT_673464 [Leotiomycetes sp. MPI-SDFR-AT-0126]
MVNNDEAFNSSDLEFDPPQESGAQYGKKSIESMLKSTFEDRVTSKQASKLLTDDVGTPLDRVHRHLVFNRFRAFYTATLQKSVGTVPSGDDIVRFFTVITSHMTSMMGHVPRYDTQLRYLNLLIPKLVFEYPDFTLSAHERLRISVCLKSLLQDGKLTNDPQREAQWVGISLVKRMIVAIVEEGIESGTRSWDVTIAKVLSIILLGVLGARCGEPSVSQGYMGVEYLRWEHIWLKLKPGTKDKLTMRITLMYEKGDRDDSSSNRVVDIDALDSAQDNALCPVKWLLIHAMRHGLVQGQNLDDIMTRAASRVDKTVVWSHPQYPVLASIKKGGIFLDLPKPAQSDQLRNTVKYAGLIAGLLALITPHDLRRGCFQDMMRASTGPATSLTDVADIMGHSRSTLHSGVSKKYTKVIQDPKALEKRIRGATEDAGAFDLMTTDIPFKRRRIPQEEITDLCKIKGLDPTKESDRKKMRSQIKKQDTLDWMEARKKDTVDDVHSQAAHKTISRPALVSLPVNARIPNMNEDEDTGNNDGGESMIDPELRDEDEVTVLNDVSNQLVTDLEAALCQNAGFELNENMHAALYPISESTFQEKSSIPWESDDVQFVNFFVQINIVRNARLYRVAAARWTDEAMGLGIVDTGNTRNMPTPYHYACTNKRFGCQFHGINKQDVKKHSENCKVTTEEAATEKYSDKPFKCTTEGCNKSFLMEAEQVKHYSNSHSYMPKACSFPGCDPSTIFDTATAWKNHALDKHSVTFPKNHRCTFPDCKSEVLFNVGQNFTQHLVKVHDLNTPAARLPYVPTWRARPCPEAGCKKAGQIYGKPGGLLRHLLNDHNIATDVVSDPRVAWD